jgi:flagellar basal-body rod modification protein FlgD
MTTPVSAALPATPITSITSPTKAEGPKDQMGKDTFLALLVAQMKYQNPMEPTDGAAMLTQTAQFSVVEKLDQLSKQNAELLAVTELVSASGLVGQQVTWTDADGVKQNGVVSSTRLSADGPVLRVGDKDVPLAKLQEVSSAPPAAPASTTTS